ncbi:GNAT family N-acetyltransferase [Azohydromonas aeria]|uniref:GNAT family N-acetyltransferase n=1 Tax=Azohydromonas aeria TaxID=2590212 RepID=UPI0012FB933D|nr:GNAT family N-acetyltransferase [Azohydromonas aeria]
MKLYTLGDVPPPVPAAMRLRKPLGPEHDGALGWVEAHFGARWRSEAGVALANRPVSMFIVQHRAELLGFACFDATARGFVGPIGVLDGVRGKGLGAALLYACLHDMRAAGYGYAVAGHVGAPGFFRRVAGAIEIPDSTPGLYGTLLR